MRFLVILWTVMIWSSGAAWSTVHCTTTICMNHKNDRRSSSQTAMPNCKDENNKNRQSNSAVFNKHNYSGVHKLSGIHTEHLLDDGVQLIIPRRVYSNGDFRSHHLIQHHTVGRSNRRSRSTLHLEMEEKESVHYQIDVNNETLHMELKPHSYFMAPQLIVERHHRDRRTRREPAILTTNCHYQGRIRGHEGSRVALSTCRGLVGHIKTDKYDYYIEPSGQHPHDHRHPHHYHHHHHYMHRPKRSAAMQDNNDGQAHVIFQKSSVRSKHDFNSTNSRKKLGRVERKQKRWWQQQIRRKSISNCGTKEPKRHLMKAKRVRWQSEGKVPSGHPLWGSPSEWVKIQGREGHVHRRRKRRRRRHRHPHSHPHPHARQYHYRIAPSNNNLSLSRAGEEIELVHDEEEKCHQHFSVRNTLAVSGNTLLDGKITLQMAETGQSNQRKMRRDRRKRSISSPRHVETLIVADRTMISFHDDVETYLLTIMNMVSALYKDPSIGNAIEIVVVKIILLEDDYDYDDSKGRDKRPESMEDGGQLRLTQNAQQNLDTFCNWQHNLNSGSDFDPHHHDVAILITRKNICGNNCMTLGLANVGGMCKPRQSCSVNEDNGIMLSHTIAHELGHNFGMFHDTVKIGCHPRVGPIVHIMTPTFGADTLQVSWSNCSRKFITQFLDQGLGDCLDDAPTSLQKYTYPEQQPGLLYNAEEQCRLQYNLTDSEVETCSSLHEICSTLWCRVRGECVTNMRPTAPGTLCGKRKWCQGGKCVRIAEVTPVNGGWGNWSSWTACSRKCGGGVTIQQRECDNPLPAHGGAFCIGERKRYKICNHEACPPEESNFRGEQCTKYNTVPYQGSLYKWLPYFDKNNPCQLYCMDTDDTIIANWGDTALDGTPCTLGTNNLCIDGICKKVGCDWIIDSDRQEDRCGICGGDGKQCSPLKGIINTTLPLNVTEGYVLLLTIPAHSRHIRIRELSNSPNFLALASVLPPDQRTPSFFLNGDNLISMAGEFVVAGAECRYAREDELESIEIIQAIQQPITLYTVIRGCQHNEGIYYEFTLPSMNKNMSRMYSWEWGGNWSPCSVSCGSGGFQYQEPVCLDNSQELMPNEWCWLFAGNTRPQRLIRTCQTNEEITSQDGCSVHWWTGPWHFCPVTCRSEVEHQEHTLDGYWKRAVRRRSVMCLDQNDNIIDDELCSQLNRPSDFEYCDDLLPPCNVS